MVTRKKQMHITTRRIPVLVLGVSLAGKSMAVPPTRLAVDDTLSLYVGDLPNDRLVISWKRQEDSLEQECLIIKEGQESRV